MLFIIAPTEHKTRIEVGYGLEPILTDAFSELIIQNAVLPDFRKNDYNGGVEQGADALIQQLSLDTSTAEAKAAAAEQQAQQDGGNQPESLGLLVAIIFIGIALFRVFGGWGQISALSLHGRRRWWLWRWWVRRRRLPASGGFGGGGGSFGGGGASGGW